MNMYAMFRDAHAFNQKFNPFNKIEAGKTYLSGVSIAN
jgi:hypothetical protein